MQDYELEMLELLELLEESLLDCTRIPFTGNRIVNEQEVIDLLSSIRKSIPSELQKATQINQNQLEYISLARKKASEILEKARLERYKLITESDIAVEVDRKQIELKRNTEFYCNEIVNKAKLEANKIKSDSETKIKKLEIAYSERKKSLQLEEQKKIKNVKRQLSKIKFEIKNENELRLKRALKELDAIKHKAIKLNKLAIQHAEKIQNDSIQLRRRTKEHCEIMIENTKKKSNLIKMSANRYVKYRLNQNYQSNN